MPPVTQALLLVNVAVFCIDYFMGPWFGRLFALWPIDGGFLPWQVVTYAFMHGSLMHIFFNMFGLWMFGSELERGPRCARWFSREACVTACNADDSTRTRRFACPRCHP